MPEKNTAKITLKDGWTVREVKSVEDNAAYSDGILTVSNNNGAVLRVMR